jgi:molybdopterin converting factor subunit 1
MSVKVLYFASARDLVAGLREESVELPSPLSVKDFIASTFERRPGLKKMADTMMVALNQEYVEVEDGQTMVKAGDEFAFIPPVSGGGEKDGHMRPGMDNDDTALRVVWSERDLEGLFKDLRHVEEGFRRFGNVTSFTDSCGFTWSKMSLEQSEATITRTRIAS